MNIGVLFKQYAIGCNQKYMQTPDKVVSEPEDCKIYTLRRSLKEHLRTTSRRNAVEQAQSEP